MDHSQMMHDHSHHEMDKTMTNQSQVGNLSMMKMYLHFGLGDELLFPGLRIDSNLKMILACLLIFIAAIILEAIYYLRGLRCQCQLRRFAQTKLVSSAAAHHEHDTTGNNCDQSARLCCSASRHNRASVDTTTSGCHMASITEAAHCEYGLFRPENKCYRLVQACLQVLATALAFALMLVAMTYNICLIFAILMGKFQVIL